MFIRPVKIISLFSKGANRPWVYYCGVSILLLCILLFGHAKLFTGSSFFSDKDHVQVYLYNALNENSNGWRADIGIGVNEFYADPGAAHIWSLFSLWHYLFENEVLAFNLTILILMWALSFSMFLFLRKVVPKLRTMPLVFLALLIPFSSLRYEFIFIRHPAILLVTAPLVFILLYDFLKETKTSHYFQYSILLFLTLFLGSAIAIVWLIGFSILFFLIYIIYHKVYEDLKFIFKIIRKYIVLNLVAGVSIITLGAWVSYSLFYESTLMEYLRDPEYSVGNPSLFSQGFLSWVGFFGSYLQPGLFPIDSTFLGIEQSGLFGSWTLVTPLFPVALIILLFNKSQNFWEFAAKTMVISILAYQALILFFPEILVFLHSIFNLYPPAKLQHFLHIFEVLFLGLILARLLSNDQPLVLKGYKESKFLALLLSMFYLAFFSIIFMTVMAPDRLESMFLEIFYWFNLSFSSEIKTLIPLVISENIWLLNETLGVSSVMFYGLTAVFFYLYFKKPLASFSKIFGGALIPLILLVNNLFLSWANYPLNDKQLIWEKQNFNGESVEELFQPTDRFVRIGTKKCRGSTNYTDCIKSKFFNEEYGAHRYEVGYRVFPSLEFSRTKSHSQKNIAEFIASFMRLEGHKSDGGIVRELAFEMPITQSRLFDISAVNYLLSAFPQDDPSNLDLVYKSKQFYLYENKNAWPYFYFADRIEYISNYEDLYNAKQGTAYLWVNENIEFVSKVVGHKNNLELGKFSYDSFEFNYHSAEQEFLVLADAWHPNWRAQVDGSEIEIIKTNGVFKGVLLPPGKHEVRFFFDNTSYLPGVWISLVSWVVFISAWIVLSKNRLQRGQQASLS